MAWSPTTYLTYGDERTRPALDLLARVPLEKAARVADLGCGPGNSTAPLVARWPDAQVVGVDNDKAMLEKARASGVRATFVEGDAATWTPISSTVDLLFSNATLQWLPDHATLFPRLLSLVRPGGALAVQMPRNFDAPSHELLRETAKDGPWAKDVADLARSAPVHGPEVYTDLLEPLAASLDIWETTYVHRLTGPDPVLTWTKGTALVPFLERLGGHTQAFLAAYAARLRAAYPARRSGVTLFPFKRLFLVAVRKSPVQAVGEG